MKPRAIKKGAENALRPSNVYDIGDNPRFKKTTRRIVKPANAKATDELQVCFASENVFGFMRGDELICRANFNADELTSNTLVVDQGPDGTLDITTFANAKNIQAVVLAFMRDVRQ